MLFLCQDLAYQTLNIYQAATTQICNFRFPTHHAKLDTPKYELGMAIKEKEISLKFIS